ncbi:MAG: carboxypeptidase-like regulatory domain-containing protein [Planctomycetota bacterium]|nr:carboxypeptidase-like regulatory domain-containing protein [Planctomycetota bacterium]
MTARKIGFLVIPTALAGLLACWLFWFDSGPVAAGGLGADVHGAAGELGTAQIGAGNGRGTGDLDLEPGAGRNALADLDAEYVAALSGFRGRLVDERRRPMTARVVRFYRLDAEVIQNPGLFAEGDTLARPKVETHEAESDEEGQFLVTGVWPHSFYILEADAEGDTRLTRPIERLPGPGEIVDLGDIMLKQLGVIVGRVVDRSNRGVAGVTVRAMDIPSSIFELAPIERFDPEGAVIVRYGEKPGVVEMPGFVPRYYDMIVRPQTVTMSDGRFRLAGVQPGENVMAFKKTGLVPRTRKGVKVKVGAERDVGDIRMSEGEEAFVKVIDTDEEPVANAEVLIGATMILFPVDFAMRAGHTDSKGEIYLAGIPAGKITVAARRSKSHPWVVGTPANVAADVVIQLPSRHHFDLTITSAVGNKIIKPEFKLMSSMDGTPLDAAALGFIQWLDLKGRVTQVEDGIYRIKDLIAGDYTLAVCAAGHGASKLDFKISANSKGEITLNPESRFSVVVLDSEDVPVRRARVFIQSSPRPKGGERLMEMPIVAGETGGDGRLEIREGQAGQVRLSASHPAFGYAHAQVTLPASEPVIIRMEPPGELLGRLTESGRPPPPGKWSIMLEPRRRAGVRGAMPDLPKMTVPNLDGDFHSRGLRPGRYRLRVIRSLKAMTSPGGMIGFMMRARLMSEDVTKDIVIEPGQPVYVELEAIKPPKTVEGPSAQVSGMVLLNGRPGKGLMVTGRGKARHGVTADANGRFDFGQVPIGTLQISVRDPATADVLDMRMQSHLWRDQITVEEGTDVVLDIDVSTGRVSGFVRSSAGAPAVAVQVKAKGRTAGVSEKAQPRSSEDFVLTDQQGRFEFDSLPLGTYRLEVKDRRSGYGAITGIEVQAGGVLGGLSINLQKVYSVSGRVDLSVVDRESPRAWKYLQFRTDYDLTTGSGGVRKDGKFRIRGLLPGTYKAMVVVPDFNGPPRRLEIPQSIVVVDRDLKDMVLVPIVPPAKTDRAGTKTGGKTLLKKK